MKSPLGQKFAKYVREVLPDCLNGGRRRVLEHLLSDPRKFFQSCITGVLNKKKGGVLKTHRTLHDASFRALPD